MKPYSVKQASVAISKTFNKWEHPTARALSAIDKMLGGVDLNVKKNHMPNKGNYLYRHYDKDDVLLYVGISVNAVNRLYAHKTTSPWFHEIATVKIMPVESRDEAERLEMIAIKEELPKYNVLRSRRRSNEP